MSANPKWSNLILPLGIVACLMVLLVPLPPFAMDILLAANLTIAVVMLLTALQVRTPQEFGVFPVLLLVTTLARLVLNIATTRLILTRGAEHGTQAAGGVIQAFGDFVAGHDLLVGAVIFLIILIVQFVVITKGATRISEVAARFTLDGMPGRQMAIDADLAAGTIDRDQARERREELQIQADFYGAMDGASKYVRGDAIAGLLITVINIVGGLFVGMSHGMSFSASVDVFTRLTVGDGLVSQLPGLLIALGAGILISRSTRPADLSQDMVRQLLVRPQVLLVTGFFLLALIFTQLPAIPLMAAGGLCIALAMNKSSRPPVEAAHQTTRTAESQAKGSDGDPCRIGGTDPLEIELGVELVGMASSGDLLPRITAARQAIAEELGLMLPKVRVRDNLRLGPRQFQILINNLAVSTGTVLPDRVLLIKRSPGAPDPAGIRAMWPSGHGAFWAEQDSVAARAREYQRLEPADVIVETLKSEARDRAADLLTRQSTAYLIDQLRQTNPETVNELVPAVMKVGAIQQVLRQLLSEGISIRPLNAILEALADEFDASHGTSELAERVRRRLTPWITAKLQDPAGAIPVVEVSAELKAWLAGRVVYIEGKRQLHLDDDQVCLLWEQFSRATAGRGMTVLLVPGTLRSLISEAFRENGRHPFVTCREEIARDSRIETIAILELSAIHYAAA
jgi:flagellar biosynthesis protein FlhA